MPTSSGIKAGKAFVIIEALDKTGKVLNSIRNRLGKFGSEISAMGQTTALRAAAALIPPVLSSKTFADFDDIMRVIQARSSGTAKEMDNIRQQALDLGEATAFTSRQIGELQAKLAQKGFSRSDILAMTEPIMNLARGGGGAGLDLGLAAEQAAIAVSGTMRAFQMEASQAERVADLFTATVNNSNFSLEELVVSMQYAAPAAHEFGQSLEDTLAVVSAMRDLNIDASISGTAFRNMLLYTSQALEREKFNERLSALTGNMIEFTDAAGNMRPVIHILTAIAEATKNMGNVEKGDLIAGLFETRASIPAAAVGKSTKTLAELLTIFQHADGLAKKTAATMESGPGGAYRMMESKVERLALALGQALAPAWMSIAKMLGVATSQATAWITANQGLVASIVAGTTAILALGVGMVVIGQLLRMVSPFFLILSTASYAMSAGFALLMSPLGAAVAALLVLWFTLDRIGDSINQLYTNRPLEDAATGFEGLSTAASSAMTSITAKVGAATTYLRQQWSDTAVAIANALRDGDAQAAMEILMAQFEVTFLQGTSKLITIWEDMLAAMKVGASGILEWFFQGSSSNPQANAENDPIAKFHKALKETNEGIVKQMTTKNPARLARQAEIDRKLLELVNLQLMQTEGTGGPDTTGTVARDFQEMLKAIQQGAGGLIGAGVKPGHIAPTTNEASIRGTADALKDFQENKFNAFAKGLTDLLGVAQNSDKHLASIDNKLSGMEGV